MGIATVGNILYLIGTSSTAVRHFLTCSCPLHSLELLDIDTRMLFSSSHGSADGSVAQKLASVVYNSIAPSA